MKRREILIFSLIFLLFTVGTINIVMEALVNRSVFAFNQKSSSSTTLPETTDGEQCRNEAAIINLNKAKDSSLQQLARYQKVCESLVVRDLMIFTDMPKDTNEAREMANKISNQLKEYSQYDVRPLVVIEPVTTWGLIDFKEFGTGFYDEWLNEYFKTLKESGLTDNQMGTWVPFPEANLPYWNNQNATPDDFSSVVNKYLGILKTYFPTAKGSILLNSATYETRDFNWENGEYISLLPYIKGLNKNYIDSFGIQGFSWMPNALSQGVGIFDAGEYLNSRLAIEAADAIGTKNIWFNTGSFRAKYTLDPELEVTLSAAKRKDILNGIIAEVLKAKDKGYNVTINLFSQDKSRVNEATDWSYLPTSKHPEVQDTLVFKDFVRQAVKKNISLSLFDIDLSKD